MNRKTDHKRIIRENELLQSQDINTLRTTYQSVIVLSSAGASLPPFLSSEGDDIVDVSQEYRIAEDLRAYPMVDPQIEDRRKSGSRKKVEEIEER